MQVAKVLLSVLVSAILAEGVVQAGEPLQQELAKLDSLRKGPNTPFTVVESRAEQLLKDYPAAEDQGRVYYQLAHTYAQGGISIRENAQRAIAYSKKALEYPLAPAARLRLFVYWGDALRWVDPKQPFTERRRAAVAVYLMGFKEAQKHDIPDQPPEAQPGIMFHASQLPPGLAAEVQREREQAVAAHERAKQGRELWLCRKVLVTQIVSMYARPPLAATELRQQAARMLQDPALVQRLMDELDKKGALKDDPVER